jgi:serine/threonine protein kinase
VDFKYGVVIKMEQIASKYGWGFYDILQRFQVARLLGSGQYGDVYLLEKRGHLPRVLKLQYARRFTADDDEYDHMKQVQNEISIMTLLNGVKPSIAPLLYDSGYYEHVADTDGVFEARLVCVFTMEKVDTTLYDYLATTTLTETSAEVILEEIKRILDTMCQLNLIHMDMHTQNIGVILDASGEVQMLVALDWGLGLEHSCHSAFEMYTLMKWMHDDCLESNRRLVDDILVNLLDRYGCVNGSSRERLIDLYHPDEFDA